jgi:hypothetical protein
MNKESKDLFRLFVYSQSKGREPTVGWRLSGKTAGGFL